MVGPYVTKAFFLVNDPVVFGLKRERKGGVMHMKMSKEEFVEKISKLELSEDRAISKLSEELQQYEKNTSCALRYSTN